MADEVDKLLEEKEPQLVPVARVNELSGKVRDIATERDTERAGRETAERERDFFQSFSEVVATNPAAKDFKDDILGKVKAGYTVEDATYAVLGKAGKLSHQEDTGHIAGGSAVITPPSGERKISEMSREEKRAALLEAEKRGDISIS